jgi:hypothetical protein
LKGAISAPAHPATIVIARTVIAADMMFNGVKLDAHSVKLRLLHGRADLFGSSSRNGKIAVSRAYVYSLDIKVT